MRKFVLLLTVGLFLGAVSANACDGGKTCSKASKAKSGCVCHGHCAKAKSSKAMAMKSKSKSACSNPKCAKSGACSQGSAQKS